MSKTIDERVVSLEFDNKNFESNARTSMSTLDKLKEKLNFGGLAKSANTLSDAVKQVDVSSIGKGVTEVHNRFSALEVMGVTALANLTNSAVNAGKRITKALTIEPVMTGLKEYETQINAVQTILANTQSKGTTLDQVNKALDELNTYADKTIYNFTEMTRNIGTFTAAGVDLNTSVTAIQGIANLAAISGSTSQQASTAMYQLSQALATGTVKLMDWNSVVNAGMGGEVFQQSLMETARVHGVAVDDIVEKNGSFRESLRDEWLTSEILTETLEKFTLTTEGLTDAQIEANREMLRSKGYTEAQIDEIFKLGQTATDAATKVKTFSQLWDVLKESAQSGWAQTWRLIIGDFEEAKSLLTPLATFLTNIIQKMSDWRNNLLEGALGKNFKKLGAKIKDALEPVGKSVDAIKTAVDAVKEYSEVVDEIIQGVWGNGQNRWDKLAKAGYDWAHAQNLVNEKLGDSTRHATNYKEATEQSTEAQGKLTKSEAKRLEQLLALSDAELKAQGFSKKQIEALRELESTANKVGLSIEDLVNNIDKIDGRWLLINSFKNIGEGIVKVFTSIKEAWQSVFNPITSSHLFNVIAGFHKLSTKLVMGKETAENLKNTFAGLFAVLDIVLTIIGGPIKIIFKVLSQFLGAFDTNILAVTGSIGEMLVKFSNWLDETLDLTAVFKVFVPYIKDAVDMIKGWFSALNDSGMVSKAATYFKKLGSVLKELFIAVKDSEFMANLVGYFKGIGSALSDLYQSFKGSEAIQNLVKYLKEAAPAILNWLSSLKDSKTIGRDIITGLVNGLSTGVTTVINAVIEIGKSILQGIKAVLGIHSPSTEFFEIGTNIIAGLVNGLQNGAGLVWDAIETIVNKCIELISSIDFGKILAVSTGVGLLYTIKKITDVIQLLSAPLEGLGNMFEGLGDMFEGIGASFKAKALEKKSEAVRNFAIAIAILVASIALLTSLDTGKVWASIGAIAVLMGLMTGMTFAVSKMGSISDIHKQVFSLIGIAASLYIMAMALKKLSKIEYEDMGTAILGLTGIILAMTAIMVTLGTFVKGKTAANIDKAGITILKISAALLIMTFVIGKLADLKGKDLNNAISSIALIGMIFASIIVISQFAGRHANKAGTMLLLMSGAILVMIHAVEKAAELKEGTVKKAISAIGMVGMLFAAIIFVSKFAGANAAKAGTMLIGMSLAMIAMVASIKLIATISDKDIDRGLDIIVKVGMIFAAMIFVSQFAGPNAVKAGAMLLMASGAFLILSGVLFILSQMDDKGLGRAMGIIAGFGMIFAALIASTYLAGDCMGTLIVLTVAIATLTASVFLLSKLDQDDLSKATIALSTILIMFSLLISCTTLLDKIPPSAIVGMGVITLLIGGLVGMLWMMNKLDVTNAIQNAAALSMLVLSLSASLVIISKVGNAAKPALTGIGLLTAMVVPLVTFIGVLKLLSYVDEATENLNSLIKLTTVMTLLLIPLTIIGNFGLQAITGVGLLTAMAIPLVAFVGIIRLMEDCKQATENINSLIKMATAMTLLLIPLTIIGAFGPAALIGIGSLVALIAALTTVVVAIGALMKHYPQMEEFVDKGITVLEKLFHGLGSMFGNLIDGFISTATSSLPKLGQDLSDFMTNASVFIDNAKKIDETVVKGVKNLAEAVISLTGASFVDGLSNFFGGSSLSEFGSQLSELGEGLSGFITNLGDISPDTAEIVETAAKVIKILAETANIVPRNSDVNMATFSTGLPELASNLSSFTANLGTFNPESVNLVQNAVEIIKKLAEVAKTLPNDGGLWGALCGENSLATFSSALPKLGTDLSSFITNLGTFDNSKLTTVDVACSAIKTLATAAKELPNDGGLWGALCGENGLAKFSSSLPALGTYLTSFINNLGTFDESRLSSVNTAGSAIKTLAQVAAMLPNDGGLWGALAGDNGLASFSSKLPQLGTDISGFVTNLGTLTPEQIASVTSASTAIRALSQIGKENVDLSKISNLGRVLVKLSEKIAEFMEDMSNIGSDSIKAAIANVKLLAKEIVKIGKANSEAIVEFGESLKKLAEDGISKFVDAFTSSDAKADIEGAAEEMLDSFIEAVEDGETDVETAFKTVASEGAKAAKNESVYSKAKSAGKYLVEGFAAGISANTYKAEAKAKAMANAAAKAANKQLEVNSPSRVFMRIGSSVVEGFVKGIRDNESDSYKASTNMADNAIKGFSKAVSRIKAAVDTEIDAQPVIRPVMDLSDVETGVDSISGMFASGTTLGVSANVNAIGTMMNLRNQNGVNDDVVSAINKLQKSLDNVGNTSYNINGITYDDGSNISNAVQSIVRAARIERRM